MFGSRKIPAIRLISSSAYACCALAAHAQSAAQPGTGPTEGSLFQADDRQRIVSYWGDPIRYQVAPPDGARQNGLWQVRLTVEGSLWLWNYNRTRRVSAPPTADAQPANDQQRTWEDWLSKKLRHDRWRAWQMARQANMSILGIDKPAPDKGMTVEEPPLPGPEPPDMLAAVGDPPQLARSVVPMQHTVTFDDFTVRYEDNVKLGNPRYAFYRFQDGVMSEGTATGSVPTDRLSRILQLAGCSESESRVMRAVSALEGGFDAVNTYDTGFVSIGFIQFASLKGGSGSLGSMLLTYKQDDPNDFVADFRRFGVDVSPNGDLDLVDPSTGAEVFGADANALIIADKRLVATFQRAGQKSDMFCAEQVKSAKAQFFPASDPVTFTTTDGQTLAGKVSDFIRSEAGLATLFDRKVNTGNIEALASVAARVAAAHHCDQLADLCHFEREILAGLKYRADFTKDKTLTQPE
jgi:hypothetical protein